MATKKPAKKAPAKKAVKAAVKGKDKVEKASKSKDTGEPGLTSKITNARHIKIEKVSNGYVLEASNPETHEKHIAKDAKAAVSTVKRFLGLK